jgi:hypothetical protein
VVNLILCVDKVTSLFNKLKKKTNNQSTMEGENVCVICLDDITSNLHSLPCHHDFHVNCIEKWTKKSNSCPLCRKIICFDFYGKNHSIQQQQNNQENIFIPLLFWFSQN